MRTSSIRGAGGALLALALVAITFTPAQATPVPASATSARLTAASPGITGLESRCPAGQVPSTIYSYQGFEAGLPFPDPLLTDGFTIKAGAGALEGTHWLNSSFQASDPAIEHIVTTNHVAVPQTGNIYLAIGYRAAVVGPFVEMHINRAVESFGSNPNWSLVILDITSEATTAGGTVDVSFRHRPNTNTPAGSFEVDAVTIYSCKVFVTPTPAGSSVQRYITRVYADLFNRTPDPTGLASWTAKLNSGTPRVAVANAITSSTEYRSKLITGSYAHYLRRPPDAGGLKVWLAAMGHGMTVAQLESGFIASQEYYVKSGSTNAGWITKLYRDVLARSAAPSEIAGWTTHLRAGMRRDRVAVGFLLSTERLRTVVDGYYRHLLGRGIDPSGQRTWVGILQRGGRDEAIIGGIIASGEYYGRV
jgi:hypothetical protein